MFKMMHETSRICPFDGKMQSQKNIGFLGVNISFNITSYRFTDMLKQEKMVCRLSRTQTVLNRKIQP